jgi:ribosome biogenesis GTPase
MLGIVLSFSNHYARVRCEDNTVRLCTIKGKRIRSLDGWYNALAAGDRVSVQIISDGEGVIEKLLPRRNVFGRFNEKGGADQAFAANIDMVVCVTSANSPPFRPRFIDRVSVITEQCGVPLLILFNKIDLGSDEHAEARLSVFESLGYKVLRCSALLQQGLNALRESILGKTAVFVGQSGTGKSSIINVLMPGIDRKVAAISEKYNRGKHTTTLAELFFSPEGDIAVIDTPGFRRLAMRNIEPDDLSAYFPDMMPFIGKCAFGASCSHTHESGCAIMDAVQNGIIHYDRYESYLRIRSELERSRQWKKEETGKFRKTPKFRLEDEEGW